MEFEDYKKQFDANFAKTTPEDFVKEMESLGVKLEPLRDIKMKTYTFEKNEHNKWFVVLPEYLEQYPGHEGELQMVFGADTMLDIIGQGETTVHLNLSLHPFEGADELEKLHDTPDVGGAMYIMRNYKGFEYNLEMWLCGVTEFVFGFMPDKIYLS